MNILSIILFVASLQSMAQSDTLKTTKLNRQKTDYSFEKGIFIISPSIGIEKNTKNNFAIDVEYALTNVVGITGGFGTSSLKEDAQLPFFKIPANKLFFGTTVGFRLHTGYNKSKIFDFIPSIYWSRVFSEYFSSKGFKLSDSPNLIAGGFNLRLFVSKHVAFDFGISKGISRSTNFGYSVGLSIK
jgi:hypothetical protein